MWRCLLGQCSIINLHAPVLVQLLAPGMSNAIDLAQMMSDIRNLQFLLVSHADLHLSVAFIQVGSFVFVRFLVAQPNWPQVLLLA